MLQSGSPWSLSATKEYASPESSVDPASPEQANDIASPKPSRDTASPEPSDDVASPIPTDDTASPEVPEDVTSSTTGNTCKDMPLKFSDMAFWVLKVAFAVGIPSLFIIFLYFVIVNFLHFQGSGVSDIPLEEYLFRNEVYYANALFGLIALYLPFLSACLFVIGTFIYCLPFPWFILCPIMLILPATSNMHTKVLFVLFVFQTYFDLPFSYCVLWFVFYILVMCCRGQSTGQPTARQANQLLGRPTAVSRQQAEPSAEQLLQAAQQMQLQMQQRDRLF